MADKVKVDLVVLIDTSGSMSDEAQALDKATQTAADRVAAKCPNDLRVKQLGVEGTWPGTKFDMSLRDYLTREVGVPESSLKAAKQGDPIKKGLPQEDGAPSIEDICNFFDWRTDALRTILYLSDDALKTGGGSVDEEDKKAATSAIATAKKKNVTVFTYLGTGGTPEMEKEYARVANETGGKPFTSKNAIGGFADILADVVCATKAKGKENGTEETKHTTCPCCVPVYVYPTPMPCIPAPWGYPMPPGYPYPCVPGGYPMPLGYPQPGMMGGHPMPQPGMMGGHPMPHPGMMGGHPMPHPGMMGGHPIPHPGMMGGHPMPHPGMMGGHPMPPGYPSSPYSM
ncbi:hypothetical protein [Baaleninema simplex]|uniref:hypothetical protein n=1 Tax=Baaleninema simplex TaxID=2862350 RepID=UPI00034B5E84|nr:hypothetical protein [Baaleninema simplex]